MKHLNAKISSIFLILNCLILSQSYSAPKNEGIPQISSEYEDLATGELRRIEGLGLIIARGSDLFVLTAGHVAKGVNLQVTLNNQRLEWKNIINDDAKDLSLIQLVDSNSVVPSAKYTGKSVPSSLLIPDHDIPDPAHPKERVSTAQNISTSYRYKAYPINTLGEMVSDQGSSFLTPTSVFLPWSSRLRPILSNPTADGRESIDVKTNSLQYSLASGFSGAPIMAAANYGYTGSIYYFAAMIVSSKQGDNGNSKFIYWNEISPFLRNLKSNDRSFWTLLNGNFVRWNSNGVIELFEDQNPIGNSIIIYGFKKEDENTLNSKFILQENFRRYKYSPEETQRIKNSLEVLKKNPQTTIKLDRFTIEKK